jgi:hypothetical protein
MALTSWKVSAVNLFAHTLNRSQTEWDGGVNLLLAQDLVQGILVDADGGHCSDFSGALELQWLPTGAKVPTEMLRGGGVLGVLFFWRGVSHGYAYLSSTPN